MGYTIACVLYGVMIILLVMDLVLLCKLIAKTRKQNAILVRQNDALLKALAAANKEADAAWALYNEVRGESK